MKFRSDVIVIVFLYPIIGLCLSWFAFNMNLLPLLFPLVAGFVLLGPVAAVGLYEMSRRHEKGLSASWGDAFGVIKSPNFGPIFALGLYLFGIFIIWMFVPGWIYDLTLGRTTPASMSAFAGAICLALRRAGP